MIRVNVICEGRTEENFVSKVLYPYLQPQGIFLTPRNLGTGTRYEKIKYNIIQWLKNDPKAWLTTMIDLYGMNRKFPGFFDVSGLQPTQKATHIENSIKADITNTGVDTHHFLPYVQLHEFESLLFSDPRIMEDWLGLDANFEKGIFQNIRSQFENPEYINDDPLTAPSKRILKIVPGYNKAADGIFIAEEIGVERLCAECPHFNQWIQLLKALG